MVDPISENIKTLDSLIRVLKKGSSNQVRSNDERSLIKATSYSWFNSTKSKLQIGNDITKQVDEIFTELLELSEKNTTRKRYFEIIKNLKVSLIQLRSHNLLTTSNDEIDEDIPLFDPLIKDLRMQSILKNRWVECNKCIKAEAPLSAVVMMGGILEAILLARINITADKTKILGSKYAPKDKNTNKILPLQNWTLKHYIDVAHDIKWITQSAKDIGETLRDYRNYVHPYKEFSHNMTLVTADSELFWQITKSIIKQLLKIK
jgi:hypothetical protein